MTKIILAAINAKYIHSNPAVYSLKAYADAQRNGRDKAQITIEIAEYTINNRVEQILADLYEKKPDVIAFSCYIWNISLVQELITELGKLLPKTAVWAGGPEVSYEPQAVLERHAGLLGIMVGEGEETFAELAEYYAKYGAAKSINGDLPAKRGQDCQKPEEMRREHAETEDAKGLGKIRGLYLRSGYTGERALLALDAVPFFYTDMQAFANRIIYYESSRGCPFRCSYCLSSIDKTVRLRSIEKVCRELQYFLDYGVPQVKFVDRTFNCRHDHAMAIWSYLHEHDNGVTNFHFEIAADLLQEDELSLLGQMRPGLVQLEIGVQSTNEATLKAIQRSMDLGKLKQVVAAIYAAQNIHQHLDLIAGLPYEDYASFANSFCEVYAMKPNQLQLGFLKVLKGSAMHEKAGEYGIIYTDRPPYEVLYSKWLPYERLLDLKRIEEMVELYYNSGQFTHVLPVLEQAFETPFAMFEALARYYREQGYFTNNPARAYRYQILLAFADCYDPGFTKLYQELCTFDLYLRENLKSRPPFARDLKKYASLCPKQPTKKTHAEVFYYPVWDVELARKRICYTEPVAVVFDYEKRNALDKAAQWRISFHEI